ncbi:hypothetical protein [Falsiporphyromonas endometrii]|uniref:CARDB domain-containing protein n=1 Tax=Falsiporphyromonas endometrii TaxID=1387297 RepID=A0ABV9K9L0_9PORP
MRKTLLILPLLLFLLTTAVGQVFQAANNPTTMIRSLSVPPKDGLCYADRNADYTRFGSGVGTGVVDQLIAVIRVPPLSSVHTLSWIGFCSLKEDPEGYLVVLDNEKAISYLQKVHIKSGWNRFQLDHPVSLEANNCVGYIVKSSLEVRNPVAFDQSVTLPPANYMGIVSLEKLNVGYKPMLENIAINELGSLMCAAGIEGPDVRSIAAISKIEGEHNLAPGNTTSLKIKVRNIGTDIITSLQIHAVDKDGAVRNYDLTCNIPVGEERSVPLNFAAPSFGVDTYVSFSVSKVNGMPNPLSDPSVKYFYNIIKDGNVLPVKDVLIEAFMTEAGLYGATRRPILDHAVERLNKDGFQTNLIVHHAGYQKDFLTVPESNIVAHYLFNAEGFVPAIVLNRLTLGINNAGFPSEPFSMGDNLYEYLKDILCREIQYGEVRSILFNNNLITISGSLTKAFKGDRIYLHAVATEDGIQPQKQRNVTEGFVHNNAIRKYLTSPYGDEVMVSKDGTFTYTIDCGDFPIDANRDKMKVVIFASNLVMLHIDDVFRHRILFSKATQLGHNITSSDVVEELEPKITVDENRTLRVEGDYSQVFVFDLNGRVVADRSGSVLSKGEYLIKIISRGKEYIKKLSLI